MNGSNPFISMAKERMMRSPPMGREAGRVISPADLPVWPLSCEDVRP